MNLFKTFSLTWWQAGAFKVGLLALGIWVGSRWPGLFGAYALPILVVAAISLAYVTSVWWRQ